MPQLTASQERRIIDDFKQDILRTKSLERPPQKEVIDYKDDIANNYKRNVYTVPLEYLRYRVDNSRIIDEIKTYEKLDSILDEEDENDQKRLGEWLKNSDLDKFEELKNDLASRPQRDVAIITCDGFLINGNRRRKVIETLYNETSDSRFSRMRVVILPSDNPEDGLGDGGAPTIEDLQRVEYAYQVQRTGFSKYTGINMALQYQKNIQLGFSLEAQLKKDPQYSSLNDTRFRNAIKKIKKDYLKPLKECDAYLEYFDRPGVYTNVSKSQDGVGRWQAFIDWSNSYNKYLKEDSSLLNLGIDRSQAAKIREIAFKIIRQRELRGGGKVHSFMRSIPKIVKNPHIRRELMKISEEKVPRRLPEDERVDSEGNPYDLKSLDRVWSGKYGSHVINVTQSCIRTIQFESEGVKPKTLLEAALSKLNHDEMDPESIDNNEIKRCIELCDEILERTDELRDQFDHSRMRLNQLTERR